MATHKHKHNTDKVSSLWEDGRWELLIISSVWVEPNSSAAGSRMLQLIDVFKSQNWNVTYASTAQKSDNAVDLSNLGIDSTSIQLNNSNFNDFLIDLKPDIVIFDRFIMEEQFGWRVVEILPNSLRILDTEDLHCLRKTRELAVKENRVFNKIDLLESEIAKREIASILRCDLSLIISTYEMELLQNIFKIDSQLLYYMPFLFDEITEKETNQLPSFEERNNFYFIGNFLHSPNYDAVLFLKKEIWPLISKQLPKAELHVFGAYPSQKITQLNNVKEHFLIKGKLKNINDLKNYKVCLAPLRFGAGIKGKLTEAMQFGIPSITTGIGAESMHGELEWSGFIEGTTLEISNSAVNLYSKKEFWIKAQKNGFNIINSVYNKSLYKNDFIAVINQIKQDLKTRRIHNFLGELLQHHSLKSSKYLSKWIEEKNKKL